MSNIETKQDVTVKCDIKINRIMFPKNGVVEGGDWCAFSANVEEVHEGEPRLHETFGTMSIKGVSTCGLSYAKAYTLTAKEVLDPKWGYQYEIVYISEKVNLNSLEDQKAFLGTILTEKQVDLLFQAFKKPLEVLENKDLDKLIAVKGIGKKTAEDIIAKYEKCKDKAQVYAELGVYGLTQKAIDKIVVSLGSPTQACQKVKANPYILIDEVDGYGWSKADSLALASGLGEYSTQRIRAYIKYYLDNEAQNGNSWVWSDDLWYGLDDGIGNGLDEDKVITVVKELEKKGILWFSKDRQRMGLKRYYNLEYSIAKELVRLSECENNFAYENWEEKVNRLEERQGWKYTTEQRKGIKSVLENQLTLIIGSGGTGKTTIVSGMLEAFGGKYSFAQCALSGRASGNMTDVTGEEGYTIHRLLGLNPDTGKLSHDRNKPLDVDIIILDEVSMVGEEIFYKLIQSIPNHTKLIMLGDIKQLESIGLGNLIKDMAESGVINTVELTKIHRQAEASGIILDSLKASRKEQIIEDKNFEGRVVHGELQDMEYIISRTKDDTPKNMIMKFKELLEQGIKKDDIQLIVPMKDRGDCCCYKLNNKIQDIVTDKTKPHLEIGKESKTPYTLYEGDRVINYKNNYKIQSVAQIKYELEETTPIFNGDLGVITKVDTAKRLIYVKFNNKDEVVIPQKHLINIGLGYCVTTHKMQGSSSPYVIGGLDYSHYKLLSREMLYTILTRAKKYCTLCAENKALRFAVNTSNVRTKQTFLKDILQNAYKMLEDFRKSIKPVVRKDDAEKQTRDFKTVPIF